MIRMESTETPLALWLALSWRGNIGAEGIPQATAAWWIPQLQFSAVPWNKVLAHQDDRTGDSCPTTASAGADFVRALACTMVVGSHVAQRISPDVLPAWARPRNCSG